MLRKLIQYRHPTSFFDAQGNIKNMYGIVIIHALSKDFIQELQLPSLINRLAKYQFLLAPNPHMTIAFVDLNPEDEEQKPYSQQTVEEYFTQARALWERDPMIKPFSVKLKDLEAKPQIKRNVTRLTMSFEHDEILHLREKFLSIFSIPGFIAASKINLNMGYSPVVYDSNSKDFIEIAEILTDYNHNEFDGKILTVNSATLVYHQNSFAMNNLREVVLPF